MPAGPRFSERVPTVQALPVKQHHRAGWRLLLQGGGKANDLLHLKGANRISCKAPGRRFTFDLMLNSNDAISDPIAYVYFS